MRKFTKLTFLFIIAGAMGACAAFAAGCKPKHAHKFSDEWTTENRKHWHAADCGHDEKDALGDCIDENGDFSCDVCGGDMTVALTGVTLDVTEKKILAESAFKLSYTLQPAGAKYATVEWSTDTPTVAEVDQSGYVTAKASLGTATITVTVDKSFSATCKVTVVSTLDAVEVTFDLNGHGSTVPAKQTTADGRVTEPEAPTDGEYEFVGWFDNAEGNGCAIDFATYTFDKPATVYAYWVREYVPVSGIELDKTAKTLKVGEKFTLNAIIAPENATKKSVDWRSGNSEVATVNDKGEVTALSVGMANVTVTAHDGKYTSVCKVTVEPENAAAPEVSLDRLTAELAVGGTLKLNATVLSYMSADVGWESDKPYVATVDGNGLVTAVSSGRAVITATVEGGKSSAYCVVTVITPAEKISEEAFKAAVNATLDATDFTAYLGDDEVAVDGAKNAIRVGNDYVVFNPEAKTATSYIAGENGNYTKRTQNCESFADCIQLALNLRTLLTEVLDFTDYDAQVEFNAVTKEYTVGEYATGEYVKDDKTGEYVTDENGELVPITAIGVYTLSFEGGRIKILSKRGASSDWEFVSFGSASVTVPDFSGAEEEKTLEQIRSETLAQIDEIYNGLLATHKRNGDELTERYNSAKAAAAAGETAEALESCLNAFKISATFDSDATIEAAIKEVNAEIAEIKEKYKVSYTKEANKPLFDALFSAAETFFENATSVQAVNDYYNNRFGTEEVTDDETGETLTINHFEEALKGIPTDEEIGDTPVLSELDKAKQSVILWLKNSWEEYLACAEDVSGLEEAYRNNVKTLWETASAAVNAATDKNGVKAASQAFQTGLGKELAKAELAGYAETKITEAGLDTQADAELIEKINDAVSEGQSEIGKEETVFADQILAQFKGKIDQLIQEKNLNKEKAAAIAEITKYFDDCKTGVLGYAEEKGVENDGYIKSEIEAFNSAAIVEEKTAEINASTDSAMIANLVNEAKAKIGDLVAAIKKEIEDASKG